MNGRVRKTFQFARAHIFYAYIIYSILCMLLTLSFSLSLSFSFRVSLCVTMFFREYMRCSSVRIANFDFNSLIMLFDSVIGFFFISFAFSIVVSLIRQEWEREIVFKQSKTWSKTRCVATKRNLVDEQGEKTNYRNVYRIVLGFALSLSAFDRLHAAQNGFKRNF